MDFGFRSGQGGTDKLEHYGLYRVESSVDWYVNPISGAFLSKNQATHLPWPAHAVKWQLRKIPIR